jgi:hypothetical protein
MLSRFEEQRINRWMDAEDKYLARASALYRSSIWASRKPARESGGAT